ncbi:zinc finger, CCHC-type containing protein [Tanacetum coccineum]
MWRWSSCKPLSNWNYHIELPSGLVIVLNNCHYAPYPLEVLFRFAVCLTMDFLTFLMITSLFLCCFDGNVLSISRNNLVYFSAIPRDGIYEIDLSSSNTNDSSMYAVSNKRAKLNLDSTLLWHCRLGHISKKRIEKLQHGLLN